MVRVPSWPPCIVTPLAVNRCDVQGHNLLGMLYRDPRRWSFQFQSYVQLTRLQILRECRKTGGQQVNVIERSLQNNRFCFLELAKKLGSIGEEEMTVLQAWYDWLKESMDLRLDLIVYLRTTPNVAFERMQRRDRKEEAGAPSSYFQHLHEAYEDWLMEGKFGDLGAPVLVVDADQDLKTLKSAYEDIARLVASKVHLRGQVIHYDEFRRNNQAILHTVQQCAN